MQNSFLFAVWPYVALACLVVGFGARYIIEVRQSPSLAQKAAGAWSVFGGGGIWRISLLLLFAAHLVALVSPRFVLGWNSNSARLYLLEGFSLVAALLALAAWGSLVWRQLEHDHEGWLTSLADSLFLGLVLVALLSGALMAVIYRWASYWGVVTLTPYIQSLFRGQPAVVSVMQMPFLVQLHVFSAFASLAAIPATRLWAIPAAVLQYCLNLVWRPISGTWRWAESWFNRHNPAAWLWPEEE